MEELRNFTLAQLYVKTNLSDEDLVRWLQELKLLHSVRDCDDCAGRMSLKKAKEERGFLTGTFFEGGHLTLKEVTTQKVNFAIDHWNEQLTKSSNIAFYAVDPIFQPHQMPPSVSYMQKRTSNNDASTSINGSESPAKKARQCKKNYHLEILRFLDSRSLQRARFASRHLNSLVQKHLADVARPHLEIVQIRLGNDGEFNCRCLPSHSAAKQYKASTMEDAVSWLRPLMRGCFIRLFNLQNLDLNEEALTALERVPECKLVQLSLVGVSLAETNPQHLCSLMQVQLRANRFYFGRIRDVRSTQFYDGMLQSAAFLAMEKIQIDIATYRDRQFLAFTGGAMIDWYFNATPIMGYAVMIVRDVELEEDFLEKLFERFLQQHTPKSISLVLCGQCRQRTAKFEQFITIRNEVQTCAIMNERTEEELEVESENVCTTRWSKKIRPVLTICLLIHGEVYFVVELKMWRI